jgi:MFS family permease
VPTSLYQQYQDNLGLAPSAITIIFAAYVLSLLAALLTVGSLSDFIGRRPAILAALALNIASMAMFMTAGSETALIAARALQGFATGLATLRSVLLSSITIAAVDRSSTASRHSAA